MIHALWDVLWATDQHRHSLVEHSCTLAVSPLYRLQPTRIVQAPEVASRITVSRYPVHFVPFRSYAWAIVINSGRVGRLLTVGAGVAFRAGCLPFPSMAAFACELSAGWFVQNVPTGLRFSRASLALVFNNFGKWHCRHQRVFHLHPA